jgi:hypothetical protein
LATSFSEQNFHEFFLSALYYYIYPLLNPCQLLIQKMPLPPFCETWYPFMNGREMGRDLDNKWFTPLHYPDKLHSNFSFAIVRSCRGPQKKLLGRS